MDYFAVACLVPMLLFGLLASQGLDMFGFWTTLLWILAAMSAAIGIYIYNAPEGGLLGFIGLFYLSLPIFIFANYRSHVTVPRLFADIYTVTAGPIHAVGWLFNRMLHRITGGAIPLKIPNPWPIVNYKPPTSRSWDIIQDKRTRRWRKLTRKLTASQEGENED
ncbi:hypothetical protein ACT3SZ_03720 [Corynebacterium sp. AOP40-9SA-29]|uniref:hypothetical protein n=1 Tax=Corynebacterium sp. AOP40-9SA-29 TaxID=3457677 RepID=UPI0040337F0A